MSGAWVSVRRWLIGAANLAGTLVLAGGLLVLFANAPVLREPESSPAASRLAAGGATQEASPSPVPTPTAAASPTDGVAPSPSGATTATPDSTPAPTPNGTVPPQPDPSPEGTPRIATTVGSLGQTLTVEGVAVTMDRVPTPSAWLTSCDGAGRESWAYSFRMDWASAPSGIEPFVALGADAYFVVMWDPGFAVNQDITVVLCHAPGDTERVLVESSPPGSPMVLYRWRFG